MAKKKKGLASNLRGESAQKSNRGTGIASELRSASANTEIVREQKPRTVYSNNSNGLASGLRSRSAEKAETVQQRAERERSNRIRSSALVSIAKTMAKNSATKKTTLPSVASKLRASASAQAPKTSVSSSLALKARSQSSVQAPKTSVSGSMASKARSQASVQAPKKMVTNKIARNALAPVSKYAESHRVTGGHGVGNYGFKTSVRQKALPKAKEIAEYTKKQRTKYAFTPSMDVLPAEQRKTKINTKYGNKLRAGMPSMNTAIMSWRSDPTALEKKYRDKYGYTQKMREALDRRLNDRMLEASYSPTTGEITEAKNGRAISAGFTDAFARENLEDTIRRQYGIEPDEQTQKQIEAQRQTVNYGAGMAAGQMAQYALTRGLLGKAGLVGKSAEAISDTNKVVRVLENRGVKTGTAKAITALMEEMGIDQAASVPLNLVDAMKADGGANVIKRFGINQGLDVLFSGLTEIPTLRRNLHFLNGKDMNDAANAMKEGTEKLSTKVGAKRHLDTAMDETGDVARQEAVEISNAGYHAGDLGKAESYFNQASSNRGTGHYGTGTYFGGRRDMFEGSSAYGNRPEWEVDFDGYNLYKPSGFDQGVRVHDNLAVIDKRGAKGLLNDIKLADDELFINKILDKAQEGVTPSNIKSKLSAVEDTAKKYLPEYRIDEIEQSARDAYEYELARATDENYLQNRENEIRRTLSEIYPEDEIDDAMILDLIESEEPPTLPNLDEFRLNYYVDELRKELEGRVPFGRTSLAENMENAQVAVKQLAQDLGVTEDEVLDAIRKSADKVEKEYPSVSQSSGRKDLDSEATLFMKNLGYDGVDVRGIEGLDNTQYGSVIYDLKPETARRQIKEGTPRGETRKPKVEQSTDKVEVPQEKVETPNAEPKTEEPKEKSESIEDLFFKKEVEEPKVKQESEPKPKEEPKAETNEEPKAEAEDTRTWQEKAKADFYESSKNRAKDVKKGKIPSKESGETVNAIKRLKETTDFSDIKDVLDRGVKDGLYNRKIRHLDEELDKAMKEIEEDPEKVINEILEYHPNGAKAKDIPADSVPFVMKGYALCKWADQNGMKVLKEDIAATMAKAQSAGGSVLRAGQVFTVMADSHTQRDIVKDFVEKMQEKYSKRLKGHKLSVPEDLFKKLDDATTDAEKSKVLDDISVHVWNQVPQSFFDAFSGLRIVSMLANTTTMIRNVASNVAFAGVRGVDKTINTMMEATAEKLGKIDKEHRTHSVYNHFSKKNREIQSYWYKDYSNHSNVIKGQSRWDESGGALNVDIRHENARHYGVKAGGGKKGGVVGAASSGIEGVRKVTTWIMDKGDEVFIAPAYADAATQLMHARGWGIDDLTPARIQEIREYATDVAQKATYRDPSDAAMALAKWGHWQKGDGGLRLARAIVISGLQPFKKTPINVGKRAVEYSPLGFAKGVYDIGAAVHAGDSKAVNKAITELSHGTTGTGLVVAGYLLAQQGLVNAKLPSDDEGYLRKDLGEQDYALTLNGKSRSLQWSAPGAVPILAGATLYDQIRQRGWNSLVHPAALVSVLSESTNPLLEMSFMQSYMDIADVTDDVEGTAKILVGLEQIGLSYAAQFIPTALGKIANVVDPVRRDTSSQKTDPYEKAVDRFVKKSIINKIPNVGKAAGKEWGSASLPAYIDYKGEEQTTDKMSERIIQNFFSPWYTKDVKKDPVAKEVIKVNKHQDENVIMKSSMGRGEHELTLDGKTYNLDEHEMEDYKKVKGKANYNNIKKLMNSSEYKSMSWSEKGKAIKKQEEAAKSEAKTEALLKKGLDEWKVRTEDLNGGAKESVDAAKELGIKPKDYVDVLDTSKADIDGNGRLSQYEVYTRLEQTDYSTEQKDMFWRAFNKGWTSDKTNPYRGGKLPEPPDPEDAELKAAKEEAETLSKAKARAKGSLAAKAFEKSVLKRAEETASLLDDSGSSSKSKGGGGRRGRSGRRGGGGSSKGTTRKQTASERKFAGRSFKLSSVDLDRIYAQTKSKPSKLSSVDLAKIYEQTKLKPAKVPTTDIDKIYSQVRTASKTKTPTHKDIKVKGLTKSQKNAMLKIMLKKINA